MLTVEVKVNGALIATIDAQNRGQAPGTIDKPGDFVGEMSRPRVYDVSVVEYGKRPGDTEGHCFQVTHDRLFGWQGLLHKITGEILPTVVETRPARAEKPIPPPLRTIHEGSTREARRALKEGRG